MRVVDAAGYPLEHDGDGVVFRPGSLFAGQERRIWVTLAVPQQTRSATTTSAASRCATATAAAPTTLAFSDVPRIACVQGEDEFYAGIDAGAGRASVTVDGYNKMQEEVAREVKAGRRDEALERLRAFKDETAALNARVQSAPVAAQLRQRRQARSAASRRPSKAPARRSARTSSASRPAPPPSTRRARRAGKQCAGREDRRLRRCTGRLIRNLA